MYLFIQFITVFIIFIAINYFAWWFTEKNTVPEFLAYKPFECRLCLTFWSLIGIYAAIGISFKLWVVLITGVVLAILNAIAMIINQRNKTIKV